MSQQPGSGPYPPQGVPPQQPQQPPYGGGPYPGAAPQPPYGSSPTPAPQAPAYGQQPPYQQPPQPGYGQQPPQQGGYRPQAPYGQEPPGYGQQPYGAPQGQPGANPYGQANAAWSPPGGAPPQPPKKKSHAGIIVAVVAIVLVLIVAGGAAMWLSQAQSAFKTVVAVSTAPYPNATKATTATEATTASTEDTTTTGAGGVLDASCSGSTIDGSGFSAKIPTGWACTSMSGGLILSDKKYDTLMVMDISGTSDAAAACASLTTVGTVTALADTQWGGKTAKTVSTDSGGSKVHVRCVSVNDSVYYLMGIPISGTYEEVVAGADALTGAWTWK